METPKVDQNQELKQENETSVKGTMFSVGIVGAVIFLTYIILYGFYMVRV